MSQLSDTDLNDIICNSQEWIDQENTLQIFPYTEALLTPVGYDIRVGNWYSRSREAKKTEIKENDYFEIRPKETVFIISLEMINMPQNKTVSAIITSKVSITAKGIVHDCTTIDPDWKGNLLIVLHNFSNSKIKLKYGQPICTIVFFKNLTTATKDCEKPPDRNDILVQKWNEITKKADKKKKVKRVILSLFFIVAVFCIGFKLFGNNAGLSAFLTAAIFLSNYILKKD